MKYRIARCPGAMGLYKQGWLPGSPGPKVQGLQSVRAAAPVWQCRPAVEDGARVDRDIGKQPESAIDLTALKKLFIISFLCC